MGLDGAAVCVRARTQALDTAPAASSSVAVSWRGGPGVMKPYDLQAQRSCQGAWRDTWLGVHLMTVWYFYSFHHTQGGEEVKLGVRED